MNPANQIHGYIRTLVIKYLFIASLLLLVWPFKGFTQPFGVHLTGADQVANTMLLRENLTDTLWFDQAESANKKLEEVKWLFYKNGYLQSSFSLINIHQNVRFFEIKAEKKYHYADVELNEELRSLNKQFNLTLAEKYINPVSLDKQLQLLLKYLENHGFPFAMVESKVLSAGDSSVQLGLNLNKGTFYTYDSLVISGTASVSKHYLELYLGIQKNKPYNEASIQQIDVLLDRLLLVRRTRNTQVFFLYQTTVIKLFIDDRSTDRFDGVIGFAPNSDIKAKKSLLLTGELNLDLKNLMNRGVQINAGWKKYLAQSQELDVGFQYPFVLNSPVFAGFKGNITRFDSLFLDTRFDLIAGVYAGGNRKWNILYGKSVSSLINTDTTNIRSNARLPSNNPMNINRYGIGLNWDQTDRISNPRKGWTLDGNLSIGIRNLVRDPTIDKVIFYSQQFPLGISLYDTLKKRSMRGEIFLDQKFYIPFLKNSTWVVRYLGKYLLSDQLYFNELYRFGGFSSIRGFDERAIFASSYSMVNIEYRYLMNEESYTGLFINAAYTENKAAQINEPFDRKLIGFGASLQLNTGKSLLQMAYALGTDFQNPVVLRNAKIHFGIINYLR